MNKRKTEIAIGKQLNGKLMCPEGCYGGKQPLSTEGDCENHLFCPHCDFSFRVKITYMEGKVV